MPRRTYITCTCCGLPQQVPDVDGSADDITICAACYTHRASDPDSVERRLISHVNMLRERLQSARTAAERAYAERDNALHRMRLALSSRERAVRYLQRINDLHALQTNGTCMCRARPRCRVAEMLAERWPQEMIRRLDDADARGDDEWDE